MPHALRFGGFLLVNVIIAVVGTTFVVVPLRHLIPAHSIVALFWEECLLSIICATAVGFSVSRKWPNTAAMWTWILPAAAFAFGFIIIAGHGPVWGRLFAFRSESVLSAPDVRSFYAFTIPL